MTRVVRQIIHIVAMMMMYLVGGIQMCMLIGLNLVYPLRQLDELVLFRNPILSIKVLGLEVVGRIWRLRKVLPILIVGIIIVISVPFLKEIGWWFSLGVLASIGLGTGVPTGMLWLFPLILKVALSNGPTKVWDSLYQLYIPTYAWGMGTAFGELPPYYMARMVHLETNESIRRIELQIEHIVKKYGFWGITFLSSYPNAFFDMCGMMCGRYGIPVKTFLGATIVGKVFIKASLQLHLLVLSAHADYFFGILPVTYQVWLMDLVRQLVSTQPIEDPHWLLALSSIVWKNMIVIFVGLFVIHFLNTIVEVHLQCPSVQKTVRLLVQPSMHSPAQPPMRSMDSSANDLTQLCVNLSVHSSVDSFAHEHTCGHVHVCEHTHVD